MFNMISEKIQNWSFFVVLFIVTLTDVSIIFLILASSISLPFVLLVLIIKELDEQIENTECRALAMLILLSLLVKNHV